MDKETVSRLFKLRRELEAAGVLDDIEKVLLLADVCEALGADPLEQATILGLKLMSRVDQWNNTRVQLATEPQQPVVETREALVYTYLTG